MDHGGAAAAKAHRPCIAAISDFFIDRQAAAEQIKVLACDSCGELERRTTHGLTIGAVTDAYEVGVDGRFPGDIATETAAVDAFCGRHGNLEHFLGKQLEHGRVLNTEQHAAHFTAFTRVFPRL